MTLAIPPAAFAPTGIPPAAPPDDYAHVRRALEFITREAGSQPGLEAVAEAAGLSPEALHRLFRRWAGLTPKDFLAAVTLDRAKRLLGEGASVLDAALDTGLSGPGRLHDLFVTHEAVSPGEWKARGAGLAFSYGYHPTPFGEAIVVASPRGLHGLGFADEGDRAGALADMRARWPAARFEEDAGATAPHARLAFQPGLRSAEAPLRVVLIGSDFEVRVWEALAAVPFGSLTSYAALAARVGVPKAARAVGAAVGRNPVSFVVPCHRVMGSGGALTGYRWGLTRKRAMLGWEAGWRGAA